MWDFPRFTRHALFLRALTTDLESLCLGKDFTCSSSKYIINVCSSSCELVFFDVTKIEIRRQVFTKIRTVTFHENPSVVSWKKDKQTDERADMMKFSRFASCCMNPTKTKRNVVTVGDLRVGT
jgi:hypothetical protein